MAPPPILALSPVLALLVVPSYSQYAGQSGRPIILDDRILLNEMQCNHAWKFGQNHPACSRYLFERQNSRCYVFWCPDVPACQSLSLEDLLTDHKLNGQSVSGPESPAGSGSGRSTQVGSLPAQAQNKFPAPPGSRFPAREPGPASWPSGNGSVQDRPPANSAQTQGSAHMTETKAGAGSPVMSEPPAAIGTPSTTTTMSHTMAMMTTGPTTMTATQTTSTTTTKTTTTTTTTTKTMPTTTATIQTTPTTTIKTMPTTTATIQTMPTTTIKTTTTATIQTTPTTTATIQTTPTTTIKTTPTTTATIQTTPTTTIQTTPTTTATIQTTPTTTATIQTTPKTTATIQTTPTTTATIQTTPTTTATIQTTPTTTATIQTTPTTTATVQTTPTTTTTAAKPATDRAVGGLLSNEPSDTSTLLAVLLFGLLFFVISGLLFLRKAYESYRKRDYTQMDYLINGIYSDSTL